MANDIEASLKTNTADEVDNDSIETGIDQQQQDESKSFKDLGLIDQLCEACATLNFTSPTEIQRSSIPYALEGKDIIGLAQTGSGKTAAFSLPILQRLMTEDGSTGKGSGIFACILAPTRELAFQISEHIQALGSCIGVRVATIVGGVDMVQQAIALSRRPHVIVATPGRLVDHLEHTKGFHMKSLRVLVLDEADRLLNLDFGKEIETILKVIPKSGTVGAKEGEIGRQTMLFSATMTDKVQKLQRASLYNPVKVSISQKYSTVSTLRQYYLFLPLMHKDTYLAYLVNELAGHSMIIFTETCSAAQRVALMLRALGFGAVALHGQMTQPKRLGALGKFSSGNRKILVATDVAARGLDLPKVDCVINYDLTTNSKTYIHRVGRTARAGKSGKSITFVTQYDVEIFQKLEKTIEKQMEEYPGVQDKESVMVLKERVAEAQRLANMEMKEMESFKDNKGRGGKRTGGSANRAGNNKRQRN